MRFSLFWTFLLVSTTCISQVVDIKYFKDKYTEIQEIENDSIKFIELLKLQKKCIGLSPNDTIYALIDYRTSRLYHRYKNDLQNSLKNLKLAQQKVEKLTVSSQSKLLINIYYYLGQNYLFLDEKEKALEYFQKTVDQVTKQSLDYETACVALKDQAKIYLSIGDYYSAISKSELGIQFGEKARSIRYKAQNLWVEAMAFYELNDLSKALKKISNSIEIIEKKNNKDYDLGSYYSFKGDILTKRKNYRDALKSYKKAEEILMFHDYLPHVGQIHEDIGQMFIKVGDLKNALKYFTSSFYLITEKQDKISVCTNIAETYYLLSEPNKAIQYYEIGLNNATDIKKSFHKERILDLYASIANFYLNHSRGLEKLESINHSLNRSIFYFNYAASMIDYMRREHKGDESKYYWRKKTRKIYESAIETCFMLKDYKKAFYFFEKSRAVLLNDKLNELGARQSLNEKDKKKESQLQSEIYELRKKLIEDNTDKNQLEKKLLLVEAEQERFIKSLEKTNPAYYQLKYDTTTFELKDIQHYLKKNEVNSLVEYFIGDSATYAIVVTPNNASLKKLIVKPEVIQKFLEYSSKSIGTKTELSTLLGYSSALYKSFVQPLNIPHGRLVISQDGVFIPFEALSKSATFGQYLLTDYAISYTYSAQILMKNQKKYGFLPNKTFLGVAPINFSSSLNSLSGSELSLGAINKNYTLGKVLTNKSATLKNFLDEAGKYKIVQLYTHAFADSNETEPKIYFADSALKVSDLNLTDQFKTNLLILSACKTGVGKVAKGEGVLSLARGFSMSGIASTITTLWSVEDKDTYTITELFHQFLNDGYSKDEALQKAKLSFIENNPTVVPYNWAGMVLVGDSSVINNSTEFYIPLLMVFLGILIGLFYKFKKRNI